MNDVENWFRAGAHPNIARLTEAFIDRSCVTCVTECFDEDVLRHLRRSAELTEFTMVLVFRQMLRAIAHIHSLHIVHLDIKADSFFVHTGQIKMFDFSLSRVLPQAPAARKFRGTCGTPPYMAPEMLLGKPSGLPVDLWSFGAMAHVLLVGEFPYMPPRVSSEGMKRAIAEGSVRPTFGGGGLTAPTEKLLRGLLDRDADRRPTASEALGVVESQSPPREPLACLRPVLVRAVRLGAFNRTVPGSAGRASRCQSSESGCSTRAPSSFRSGSGDDRSEGDDSNASDGGEVVTI